MPSAVVVAVTKTVPRSKEATMKPGSRPAYTLPSADSRVSGTDPTAAIVMPPAATARLPIRPTSAALLDAARAWVHAVRTNKDVIALRNLVAAEQHRFPELGRAWHGHVPESHHPAVAGALRALADQGRLVIPDLEAAIIQLYALLVFPHMVFSTYGTHIEDDLTDRLIVSGVDMFLRHYGPGREC
ncbi:TetR/AcrR family transcriptional regulator C-terminal domain-containing protein [Streptomyces sp. NPDC000851]